VIESVLDLVHHARVHHAKRLLETRSDGQRTRRRSRSRMSRQLLCDVVNSARRKRHRSR
jgi:hypothetical protein